MRLMLRLNAGVSVRPVILMLLLFLCLSPHIGPMQCGAQIATVASADEAHARPAREDSHNFFQDYDEPRYPGSPVNMACTFKPDVDGFSKREWLDAPYDKPNTVITSGISLVQIYYGAGWSADKMDIINNFLSNIIVSDYFTTVSRSVYDNKNIYATSSIVIGGTAVVQPTETSFKNDITSDSQLLNLISVARPKLSKQTQSVSLNQTIHLIYIGCDVQLQTKLIKQSAGAVVCGYHSYDQGSDTLFAVIIESACFRSQLPPTIKPSYLIGAWNMASTIAHELAETISNPIFSISYEWVGLMENPVSISADPKDNIAIENADKCSDCYGSAATRELPSGSIWNMALGSYKYLVQETFDPRSGLCALRGLKPPYDTTCRAPSSRCKFAADGSITTTCDFFSGVESVCERISPTSLIGRCKCKPGFCYFMNRGCILPFPLFPTSCPWYASTGVSVTGSVPAATPGSPVPIGTKLTVSPSCVFTLATTIDTPISNIPDVVSNTITCMTNGLWNFNPVCLRTGPGFTKKGVQRIPIPAGTQIVAIGASAARLPATHCTWAPYDNPIYPEFLPNGQVDIIACRNATVGMHCILECNQGYSKTNDFICRSNGLWSTAYCAACPFAQIQGARSDHSAINGFYSYVGTYNDSPLFRSAESAHNSALKNIFIYKAMNGLWHIGTYMVGSTSKYIYRALTVAQNAGGPFNNEKAVINWIESHSGTFDDNLVVQCACGAMRVTMDSFNVGGIFVADYAALTKNTTNTNTAIAVYKLIEIHTLSAEQQSHCLMCHQYSFQLFRTATLWVLNVTDNDASQTHFATLSQASSVDSEELLPFNSTWHAVSFLATDSPQSAFSLNIASTVICESICKSEPPFPDGGYVRVRLDGHTCGTRTKQGTRCTATCLSPRGSTPSGFLTCQGGNWNHDDNVTCLARCATAPPSVLFGAPASGCEGTAHGGVCPLICSPGLYKSSDFICNNGDWEINSTACVSCPLLQISGVTTDMVVNGFYDYKGLDSMGIPYYVSKTNNLAIVSHELAQEWFIQEYRDDPVVYFVANYSGQMLPYNVPKGAWTATGIYSDDDMIVACACPAVSLVDSKQITGFSGDFVNLLVNETTGEFAYFNTRPDVHPSFLVSAKDAIGMFIFLLVDDLKTNSINQSYAFTIAVEKYLLLPSLQAGNLTWLVRDRFQSDIQSASTNNNKSGFSPYPFLNISNRCNLIETCSPPSLPNNAIATLNRTTYPSGGTYPLNCSFPYAPSSMFLTCTDGSWDVQTCDAPCSLAGAANNTDFMGSGGFVNASLCEQAVSHDWWASDNTKTSGTTCPLQCSNPGSFPSGEFVCHNSVWETSECLNFCPVLILQPGNTSHLDLPQYYPRGSASVFTFLEFDVTTITENRLPIFESDTRKFLYAVNDSALGIFWAVSDVKGYTVEVGIILRSTPQMENYPLTPFNVPAGTWQTRQIADGLVWVADGSVSVTQGGSCTGDQPTEVPCPVNSHGPSIGAGCRCNDGFYGHVTAMHRPPFYHSSCEAVSCPEGTFGTSVPIGCLCEAGYSGNVVPLSIAPYYNITCKLADCPTHSYRTAADETDCACEKGFEGYVTASNIPPFFNSTCTSVACPANSHGLSVADGCTCNQGFTGVVTAIHSIPYFTISDDDHATEVLASLIINATYDEESDVYQFSAQIATPAFESTCVAASSSIFGSLTSLDNQQLLILLVCVLGSASVVALLVLVWYTRNKLKNFVATGPAAKSDASKQLEIELAKHRPEGGGYVEVAVFSESSVNDSESAAAESAATMNME